MSILFHALDANQVSLRQASAGIQTMLPAGWFHIDRYDSIMKPIIQIKNVRACVHTSIAVLCAPALCSFLSARYLFVPFI